MRARKGTTVPFRILGEKNCEKEDYYVCFGAGLRATR